VFLRAAEWEWLRALHLRPSSAVGLLRRMDLFEQPVQQDFLTVYSAYVTLSATVTGMDKYSVDKGCFFTYRLNNLYD
jgi:hypothetical protein